MEGLSAFELYRMSLVKSQTCSKNLSNLSISLGSPQTSKPYKVDDLKGIDKNGMPTPIVLASINQWKETGLSETRILNFRTLCSDKNEFLADFELIFESGEIDLSRRFPIYIQTDASGRLEKCSSSYESIDTKCVDCAGGFTAPKVFSAIGSPSCPPYGGACMIAADTQSLDQACKTMGCGTMKSFIGHSYSSCGDNGMWKWDGSNWAVINACSHNHGLNPYGAPALFCND